MFCFVFFLVLSFSSVLVEIIKSCPSGKNELDVCKMPCKGITIFTQMKVNPEFMMIPQ